MTPSTSDEGSSARTASLLESFRALGPAKLAAMGLVAVGMLCMLAVLVLRSGDGGGSRMALLYGDLDLHEAGQMADLLEKAHIAHDVSGQGDQIMVALKDVASARLLLAKASLPSGGSVGYEIFDRGDSLTSTQFEQEINETRALEGELVRSITLIQGVKGARVHLVLPHRDLFAQEEQPAQASVLLTLRGSTRLDAEEVQAILNLVSAAVPGLKAQSIAIIDNHGSLFARNGTFADDQLGRPDSVEELRQSMEMRLARNVEEMLDASLGPDRVRAEASVTLDDSSVNETQETYDPDQQVLRSQETSSDKTRTTDPQQNTSVQNNLPNSDAGRTQAGSQDDKREETSNYEVGKTVRNLTQTTPRIRRITLAVIVDDGISAQQNGGAPRSKLDAGELSRMTELVKSAIGFDPKRGDVVTVESMHFNKEELFSSDSPVRTLLNLGFSNAELIGLGQTCFISMTILTIGLLVFRPLILRLTRAENMREPRFSAVARTGPVSTEALASSGGRLLLSAPDAIGSSAGAGVRSEAQMLTQFEIGQTRNSSARRLGELVEQFPEESLTLVRGWLSDGVI